MPLLGDLPLIGAAFRSDNDSQSDRELIVFITPHIVQEPARQRAQGQHPRSVAMADREQDIRGDLLKAEEIDRALSSVEHQVESLLRSEQESVVR